MKRSGKRLDYRSKEYIPIDELHDYPQVKVLSYLYHHEWLSCSEVIEGLQIDGDTERNTVRQTLLRLSKDGLIDKRMCSGLFGYRNRDYKINESGKHRLQLLLSRSNPDLEIMSET